MAYNEKARATVAAKKAARDAEAAVGPQVTHAAPVNVFAPELPRSAQPEFTPEQLAAAMQAALAAKPATAPARTAPRNLFDGSTQKLQVYGKDGSTTDPIPGFRLRWFNDTTGGLRINQAMKSGWQMVQKEEVDLNDAETSPGNTDLGTQVRRWVSGSPTGDPVYAFLMKKPRWMQDEHDKDRDAINDNIEAQLRNGTLGLQAGEKRYTGTSNPYANSPSTLPAIRLNHR